MSLFFGTVQSGSSTPHGSYMTTNAGPGTWTVPTGVYRINLYLNGPGAPGGTYTTYGGGGGGGGGYTSQMEIASTPGNIVNFYVGKPGYNTTCTTYSLLANNGTQPGFGIGTYGYGGSYAGGIGRNGLNGSPASNFVGGNGGSSWNGSSFVGGGAGGAHLSNGSNATFAGGGGGGVGAGGSTPGTGFNGSWKVKW